jgi:hypothetical protein
VFAVRRVLVFTGIGAAVLLSGIRVQAGLIEYWDFNGSTVGSEGTDVSWLADSDPPQFESGGLLLSDQLDGSSEVYRYGQEYNALNSTNFAFKIRIDEFDHSSPDARDTRYILTGSNDENVFDLRFVTLKKDPMKTRLVLFDPSGSRHVIGTVTEIPTGGPIEFGINIDFVKNEYTVLSSQWVKTPKQTTFSYDMTTVAVQGLKFEIDGSAPGDYELINGIALGNNISYDSLPVPEPYAVSLVCLAGLGTIFTRRLLT